MKTQNRNDQKGLKNNRREEAHVNQNQKPLENKKPQSKQPDQQHKNK